MQNLVIYHGNCYDGVTAAYVCWLKFKETAEYVSFNYSDKPPNVEGRNVIIVDFSFKRDAILKMKEEAKSLLILDHHKTAEKELENLDYAIFDMERSGAGLAWDYYFGDNAMHAGPGNNRPILVNYIEDRDLWRFKLTNSKEINAWIQSWDIDLHTWIKEVSRVDDFAFQDIVNEGKTLLRQQDKLVKSICYNAELKNINQPDGHINSGPYVQTSILMSEVCDQMLKISPTSQFAWYSFKRKDGKYQYGLRSRSNFDVSIIAKQFGGGGHKQAAGFELDYQL